MGAGATTRPTVSVSHGDVLLVAQYRGPHLPAGATSLPEGGNDRILGGERRRLGQGRRRIRRARAGAFSLPRRARGRSGEIPPCGEDTATAGAPGGGRRIPRRDVIAYMKK